MQSTNITISFFYVKWLRRWSVYGSHTNSSVPHSIVLYGSFSCFFVGCSLFNGFGLYVRERRKVGVEGKERGNENEYTNTHLEGPRTDSNALERKGEHE